VVVADLTPPSSNLAIARAPTTRCALRPLSTLQAVDRYVCLTAAMKLSLALQGPPAVIAAIFDVDIASTTIRVAEAAGCPPFRARHAATSSTPIRCLPPYRTDQASILARCAPIYIAHASSQTRQPQGTGAQSRLCPISSQPMRAPLPRACPPKRQYRGDASRIEVRAAGGRAAGVQRGGGRPAHSRSTC